MCNCPKKTVVSAFQESMLAAAKNTVTDDVAEALDECHGDMEGEEEEIAAEDTLVEAPPICVSNIQ